MSQFRGKDLGFRKIIISMLVAGITVLVSGMAFAATNYQLTVPQRMKLRPGVVGQDLPHNTMRATRKTAHSNASSKPSQAGSQLYQTLTQHSASRVGLGHSKKAAVRSVGIISDAQQQNLKSLNGQLKDNGGVKVIFDTNKGTPTLIKPLNESVKPIFNGLAVARPSKSAVAMQFLKDNRELLKLGNPESELHQISQSTDRQNKTHIRFQQMVNGIPIWGKQALVHVDKDDGVYLFQGRYEPTLTNVNTTPAVAEQTAIDRVLQDLNVTGVLPEPAHTELVVYTTAGGSAVLTYKVDISPNFKDRWIYFIDATTGAVVHKIYNIHKNVVQASGLGLDNVLRTFPVWSRPQDGRYYLIDPDTPTAGGNADPVADGPRARGDTYILNAQNGDGSQLSFIKHNAQTNWPDPVAVSATHNTRLVYEYYLDTFNRNSVDGNGKNLMVVVHFQNNFDNAFWNGTFMVYGDGGNAFTPLSGCLDVTGHEMTHGVIETAAALIYENQSGALNESFADVFGAMIDRDDWLLGENCTKVSPFYLRSMKNPANGLGGGQPTRMSEYQNLPNTPNGDNGGVHINSGIPNRAAYLIAEGLSAEGIGTSIGRTDTEQIYYLALTEYLTQSSQFIDARRALIQAAEDLHGGNSLQVKAVVAAFDAVGITDGDATPPTPPAPTPTDPVAGDEIMVYLYPFDGGHEVPVANQPLERLDLYTKIIGGSVSGPYNDPLHGDLPAFYTRPAVVTTESGTDYLYVGTDYNVYQAVFGNRDVQLSQSGDTASIAISPSGRYMAYTSIYADDNNIYITDFDNGGKTSAYAIVSENYQDGSTIAGNTILYADALSFDYTGNVIVFDALNCLSTPDSLCSNGSGYRYWSIGVLNLITGQFYFPVSSQSPDIDLGFPSFAANNNYVIALDFLDYSNFDSLGKIGSQLITIDFETQEMNFGVHDYGLSRSPFYSVPSFWGDDAYITAQMPVDAPQYISAGRVQVDANWEGNSALQPIVNSAVAMPIMHRTGVRTLTGALTPNVSLLDFGEVSQGYSKQLALILSNYGNNDVNIFNIESANGDFLHNGINTRVPKNQSRTIMVTYSANQVGTHSGNLIIESDSQEGPLVVSLVATTIVDTGNGGDSGTDGGHGEGDDVVGGDGLNDDGNGGNKGDGSFAFNSGSGGGNGFGLVIALLISVLIATAGLIRRHSILHE